MNIAPFYLHATEAEARPALTLGQGYPTSVNSLPAYYFWRPVIADGEYTHPTKGFRLAVDAARRKGWEANFRKMSDAGEKVPVVKDHADDKSDAMLGYVVDVRQNGAWLEELHQYLGDDARDVALRNQISVGIDPAYVTGKGIKLGDCIVHSATTPRPVVPGQGQAVPFAAARGSGDILELSVRPTKEIEMDLTALRKAIGAADTVTDADVISQASAKIGTIPTIEAAKATAETSLATAQLQLSRASKPADDDPFPEAVAKSSVALGCREIELMAREGSISGEQATAAKALLGTADKPNTLMLSREGANHPFEGWLKVLALGKNGVNTTGEQQTGVQELVRPTHDHSAVTNLSRDKAAAAAAKTTSDAKAEAAEWQKRQLSQRGLAIAV